MTFYVNFIYSTVDLLLISFFMKRIFTNDLSEQHIYAEGIELATVMWKDMDADGNRIFYTGTETELVAVLKNPVLMTDLHKISQIEDYIKKVAVEILYSKAERGVEFDGFSMKWNNSNQYPRMWFPSIDTLFFCSWIRDLDFSDVKRIAEIGSGPGFIGQYVATKSPSLQELWLNDINPSAEKYFGDINEDSRANFVLQDGKEFLQQQETFDVVVCNPPYLPRPKSIDDNAYEGLSLVEYLISNCKSFLTSHGRLFIVLPTFAESSLSHALSHPEIEVKLLGEKEVPLKVSTVLNNPEWMKYLLSKWLKKEMKQGHEYWQTIKLFQITPQKSE